MQLRSTNENDIELLLTWFKSHNEVKNWGGPKVRFPLYLEQFKKDIGFNIIKSFSLLYDNEVVGFVQTFDRFGCIHIGRVLICPNKRGNGLGIKLIKLLFDRYKSSKLSYSLFVYKDNIRAKNLYEKLGFKVSCSSTGYEEKNNCFFMKK